MSQFSSLEGLLVLGQQVDIRPTLLRVLTDLYMQKAVHSHDEEVHYTELALRLIESVDEPTRQIVRTALHSYPAAPRAVVVRLAATPPPAAPAPPPQTEPPVAPATTKCLRLMAPPTAVDLTEEFFAADPDERRLILLHLHHARPPRPPRGPLPNAAAIIHRIETAVLQRNVEEATWQVEQALGIGRPTARRIVSDETGEPFLVAARMIGIPTHVLHRILLFLNPSIGRSVQRVYDLAALYDEIDPATAAWLVAIWRDAEVAALNQKTAAAAPNPPVREPVARPERSAGRDRPLPQPRVPLRSTRATTESVAVPQRFDARSLLAALDTRIRGDERK